MLTIENLHAQVERKQILNGIDLDVKAGEVHSRAMGKVMPTIAPLDAE